MKLGQRLDVIVRYTSIHWSLQVCCAGLLRYGIFCKKLNSAHYSICFVASFYMFQ